VRCAFMKRFQFYNLVLFAAVLVSSRGLGAEGGAAASPQEKTIGLEALVADVVRDNPELRFYEAEIAAAKAGRRTAGSFANPELSGGFGQKSVRESGVTSDGAAWSVSVMQPFEWPGRIGLRKAIANRDVELAELGYQRFRSALAGRVRTLAYGLFAAREKAAAAREVADRFQSLRETLVQRDPAGLTPLLETRVIEATELTFQRKASEAVLAERAALMELNQLRGAVPLAEFQLAQPSLAFRPAESLETLLAMAGTNNFELRVRTIELAQQGFRVDLAKNERFPGVSVGPTFSEERAGDRERIVSLGISLPLPLWNRNSGNVEAARARQLQAEVSLDVALREMRRQVAEAAMSYETRLGEMNRWRADSVAQFREAAELADRHYRLGAVPISTYVELQKQYLDAVESLLDTRREILDAAQRLELLTGLQTPLATAGAKGESK